LKDKLVAESETISVEQRLEIEDQIKDITETIRELKLKKKEYFLDNSKFIFDYFENKKNISSGVSIPQTSSSNKNKIVTSFFKLKEDVIEEQNDGNKTSNIVQKYLTNIDDCFSTNSSVLHLAN
jgi:hypothetical protein